MIRRSIRHGHIYSLIRVKIFGLENKTCALRILRPTPGNVWNDASLDQILKEIADDLEAHLPGYEYKLVEVGKTAFNFVWVGPKPLPPNAEELLDQALYGTPGDGIEQAKQTRGRSWIAEIVDKLKLGGKDGTSQVGI